MRFAPDIAREHVPRHGLSLMAHEVLQQLELARRQIDRGAVARDLARAQIDIEAGDPQPRQLTAAPAPNQRPHAGDQLGEGKWLDEIVVGAGIEPEDAIVDGVLGRENQHRRRIAAGAQRGQHIEAVAFRQHEVEHDRIEALRAGT
jgi:hypothetical protein